MSDAKTTTDHEKIKEWVCERGGLPARVRGTEDEGSDEGGVLRIKYPQAGDNEELEEITWEEFFETFDENKLAFLHQDKTEDGETSRFSKLVKRSSAGR
jgi:hypothetical protein